MRASGSRGARGLREPGFADPTTAWTRVIQAAESRHGEVLPAQISRSVGIFPPWRESAALPPAPALSYVS